MAVRWRVVVKATGEEIFTGSTMYIDSIGPLKKRPLEGIMSQESGAAHELFLKLLRRKIADVTQEEQYELQGFKSDQWHDCKTFTLDDIHGAVRMQELWNQNTSTSIDF